MSISEGSGSATMFPIRDVLGWVVPIVYWSFGDVPDQECSIVYQNFGDISIVYLSFGDVLSRGCFHNVCWSFQDVLVGDVPKVCVGASKMFLVGDVPTLYWSFDNIPIGTGALGCFRSEMFPQYALEFRDVLNQDVPIVFVGASGCSQSRMLPQCTRASGCFQSDDTIVCWNFGDVPGRECSHSVCLSFQMFLIEDVPIWPGQDLHILSVSHAPHLVRSRREQQGSSGIVVLSFFAMGRTRSPCLTTVM